MDVYDDGVKNGATDDYCPDEGKPSWPDDGRLGK